MAESSSRIQLTDVKETITCGICLQIFTDPRGLTCGHTYCLVCLKGFQGTSSVKECPVCRAKTIPKSSELENLPVNKLAGDLVKLVHQYEPSTIEAPPQWRAPEVREKRPAARISGFRGDFLNFALSGGRADLGMLSAALTGLQTDLQEHLLEEVRPVQESEESDQNSSRPQHSSITCDECRSSSIRGHRYKCGICDDYDLCEKCQKIVRGAVHDPEHLLIKFKRPATTNPREQCPVLKEDAILIGMSYNETATVHKRETDEGEAVDIICSHCGRGPISGVRFMCGDCEKTSEEIHDNKHLFLVIDHPTQYHPTQAQLTHNFYGAIQDTEGQSQDECAAAAAAASQAEHGPITDITTLKMQSSENTE